MAELRRPLGALYREVAERPQLRRETRLRVIVAGVLDQALVGALVTEVVLVRANSAGAVVRRRDDDGEQLPVLPRQLGLAEHDRLVQTHRRPQQLGAEAHRLDDVVDLPRARSCRVVLLRRDAGGVADLDEAGNATAETPGGTAELPLGPSGASRPGARRPWRRAPGRVSPFRLRRAGRSTSSAAGSRCPRCAGSGTRPSRCAVPSWPPSRPSRTRRRARAGSPAGSAGRSGRRCRRT
jgi:hypothetical protein